MSQFRYTAAHRRAEHMQHVDMLSRLHEPRGSGKSPGGRRAAREVTRDGSVSADPPTVGARAAGRTAALRPRPRPGWRAVRRPWAAPGGLRRRRRPGGATAALLMVGRSAPGGRRRRRRPGGATADLLLVPGPRIVRRP